LKTLFHSSFLENQLKIVYFGVVQLTTYEISSCQTLTKFVESSYLKYIYVHEKAHIYLPFALSYSWRWVGKRAR
jgi:hypothetical protein